MRRRWSPQQPADRTGRGGSLDRVRPPAGWAPQLAAKPRRPGPEERPLTRAFLFDIDGTLVDSAAAIERAWREVAGEFGVSADAVLRACHGRRDVEVVDEFFEPGVRSRVLGRIAALDLGSVAAASAVPGASGVLGGLDDGQWAAVTSGPRGLMTARLRAAGLPVPRVMVTAEDVVNGKPDPEGFLLAARTLGHPPAHCVVVEDSPAGVAAGRAAGATVVGITTTHRAADLVHADLVVEDLRGLPEVLDEFFARRDR